MLVAPLITWLIGDSSPALTTAVAWDILQAVQTKIVSLDLSRLPPENVVIRKLVLERFIPKPGIALAMIGDRMPTNEGTCNSDDVTYSMLLVIYDIDNQEPTFQAHIAEYLSWKEQIAKAFRNQRLPGAATVYRGSVEPAETVIPEAWKNQLFATALVLKFISRELRTTA